MRQRLLGAAMMLVMTTAAAVGRDLDLGYVSMQTVTPHTPWARPYAGGRTRVLALVCGGFQMREVVELMQRFDLDVTSSLMVPGFGPATLYAVNQARLSPDEMKQYYSGLLAEDRTYDAILMSGNAWDYLDAEARRLLSQRVEGGAGLLWLNPMPSDPKGFALLPVSVWKQSRQVALQQVEPHPLTAGLPGAALPQFMVWQYEYKPDLAMARELEGTDLPPLVLEGRHGRGRVVLLTYNVRESTPGTVSGRSVYTCGILPTQMRVSETYWDYPYWDHLYALVGRALLRAAGKHGDARFRGVTMPKSLTVRQTKGQVVTVNVDADADMDLTLSMRIRDVTGTVRHQSSQPAKLQKGSNSLQEMLPAVLSGPHVLDFFLAGSAGHHDWWSADLIVAGKDRIDAIKLTQPAFQRSQPMTGSIAVTTNGPAELGLQLRDGHGRLIAESTVPAAASPVAISLPLQRALGTRGSLEATLRVDGQPVCRRRQVFAIAADRSWDDFEIMMWQQGPEDSTSHLYEPGLQAFARMGVTTIVNQYASDRRYMDAVLDSNMKMCTRIGGYGKGGLRFSDPADEFAQRHQQEAAFWSQFGPLVNMAGDESFPSAHERNKDEMSDEALARFRHWLQQRYTSLDNLNRSWGTSFKSWDRIIEPVLATLQHSTGNFAPWHDLQSFVEETFVKVYQIIQAAMAKGDPQARNASSGTQSAYIPGKRHDWWRLMTEDCFRACLGYTYGDQLRLRYSFGDLPHMDWNGYGSKSERLTRNIVNTMWRGCDGTGLFAGRLFLNPDYSWNESSQGLVDAVPLVRHGMGKLLRHTRYAFDPVAVYYSQASIHAAEAAGLEDSLQSAVLALAADLPQSLGIATRYVSTQQVSAGELDPQRYRLLIMPHVLALSDAEAEAVRAYVTAGGVVLADLMPGLMDGSARMRNAGALDDVFGIQRTLPTRPAEIKAEKPAVTEIKDITAMPIEGLETEVAEVVRFGVHTQVFPPRLRQLDAKEAPGAVTASGQSFAGLAIDVPTGMPVTLADHSVTPAGATALATETTTGAPVLLVNRVGKGLAVLVNADVLDQCGSHWRRRRDDAEMDRLTAMGMAVLGPVLTAAGLQPQVLMVDGDGRAVPRQSHFIHEEGVNCYVRAFHHPLDRGPLRLKLASRRHVYELPAGRYVGAADTIELPSQPALGLAYALMETRVESLAMQVTEAVAPGGDVVVKFSLPGAKGLHVVRLELSAGEQALDHYSASVLCRDGAGEAVVRLALDDPVGRWELRARDVVTGLTARATVQVGR